MKETIMLFHVPDKSVRLKIETALFPLHVRLRYVQQEEYNQTLGALLKLPDSVSAEGVYDGEPLPAAMIIFAGLPDQKLNQALLALRRCGAGPFPYKAVLTPTNQNWTPLDCFAELKREHEYMNQQKTAQKKED